MKADVRIFKDHEAMSVAATEIFVGAAAEAIHARGRFLVALSGGGTPSRMYRLLASEPGRSRIDWEKTFVFWGDERCVPPDDPGSNYYQAEQILFSNVPIPEENILRIKGELEPGDAADAYAQALKEYAAPGFAWPRFDLVLLGMGADGHTASLFPGSHVEAASPTLAVSASYQGRPARRVTLTPVVINSARKVLFLVSGEDKSPVLKLVLSEVFNPEKYPTQRIQPADGQVIWLLDEAAGTKLL